MRSLLGIRLALALLALSAGILPGRSENFYQGKQVVVLVNFPPGGPADTEARLIARNLSRTVVGNPAVIVQNMAGANGAAAANWLATAAAPDGLIMGYFSGIATMRALDDPALSENVARLAFVAATSIVSVSYARSDIGGGIKNPKELLSKRDFWVGGLRPDSDRDMRVRLQLDLLGVKHNYQPGFGSIADARQAFQRGEIQVLMEPMQAYRTAIEPTIVNSGRALPLWFDPLDDGETFNRVPDADNIPALTFTDVLIQMRGELPKSEMFEAWRLVNQMGTLFSRVMVLAPATPPAAVEALRKAIRKLAEDAAFKEDAFKTLKFVPNYLADAKTAGIFTRVTDPEPQLKTFLRGYVAKVAPDAISNPPPPQPGAPAEGEAAPAKK